MLYAVIIIPQIGFQSKKVSDSVTEIDKCGKKSDKRDKAGTSRIPVPYGRMVVKTFGSPLLTNSSLCAIIIGYSQSMKGFFSMKRQDLTKGPIFSTLALYALPIIFTNLVQLLFHAADVAVLSVMASGQAVAATGACGSIITLMVSLFTGFATGANVLVARRTGAGDVEGVRRASGTAMTLGFASGVLLMIVAVILARPILVLTNCQEEVLDMAVTYMRVYFLGMPITMLYNFAASVLRATGDSLRPMIYINLAGVLNVLLNILFVGLFELSVLGVALATVLSNLAALILVLRVLLHRDCICRIERKNLCFGRSELAGIVSVGIPTCLCSIFFYLANVILTAKVNSMGTDTMTANAISGQFDGAIYTVGCAIAIAASAMAGQNYGAGRFDRIRSTLWTAHIFVTAVSLALGTLFVLIAEPLLGLLSDSEAVIAIAVERMTLLCLTYFVTSIMEVFAFCLRSVGYQRTTMVVGAICGLGIRAFWAYVIWPMNPTLPMLYICFPISAAAASLIYLCVYLHARKKWARMEADAAHAA